MNDQLTYTGHLVVQECWCGIRHAIPEDLSREHGRSTSHAPWCPLGPGAAGLTATQGHLRRRARPRPAWAWALSSRRPCWARSVPVHTHLPCAAVELHAEGVGFTANPLSG